MVKVKEKSHVIKSKFSSELDVLEKRYSTDDTFNSDWENNPHTTYDLARYLQKNKDVEFEGNILHYSEKKKKVKYGKLNRDQFLEGLKSNAKKEFSDFNLKESSFDDDMGSGVVGDADFIPIIGGPFYKQMYYHDYFRMHNLSFHAYHHDPLARRIVTIMRDFTLGRGWRVDVVTPGGKDQDKAQAWWKAFEKVNDLYKMMDELSREASTYGEIMIWELPDGATKITYDLKPGQEPPKGIIPRMRLIDPSVIWEIVTYPEDITRVLYYQWVAPTQYQIYTGRDKGQSVPASKYIFQQIPGDQMMHFKLNSMSNEKRGRSDLFPVLGYLKRLRDSVNYSIIGMQKSAAWAIDTTIEGNQQAVDDYVKSQQALGTIPPAGSEFVHSAKVTREYLSNSATAKGGDSKAFDWCMSMVAIGTGIPVSYFGSHLSGGQTRASALIASEPVAKVFEMRQEWMSGILKEMAGRLFKKLGIDAEIEVTFPENIVQDRSAKLRDLSIVESRGWISKKRAAELAAQELELDDFDYEKELEEINAAGGVDDTQTSPLSSPPIEPTATAVTAPQKAKIASER